MNRPESVTQIQARARYAVARAIKKGDLVRQPCVVCGSEPTDGHHEDYAKPVEVIWLCRIHHRWVHCYGDTVEQMRAERQEGIEYHAARNRAKAA